MVNIGKLLKTKPPDAMPVEFESIGGSQIARKRLIEKQFQNLLAWAKTKGFNPEIDYYTPQKLELLARIQKQTARYNAEIRKVANKINAAMKVEIQKNIRPEYEGKIVKWSEKLVIEKKDAYNKVTKHVQTTPEKLCEELFANAYAEFETNPLKNLSAFREEVHSKLHGRVISEWVMDDKTGDMAVFEIKLLWAGEI